MINRIIHRLKNPSLVVERDWEGDLKGVKVDCWCGWTSNFCRTERIAIECFTDHKKEMTDALKKE